MKQRAVFAVACLGMLAFGVVLTTLGAVLPSIITRFGIDKAEAGTLFLMMTFGILASTVVVGPIADARGFKGILMLATGLIAAALVAIAYAPSMVWLRVAVIAIGVGGGFVNASANALAADVSADDGRSAGLSLLGVFFGLGAVGVPFALGTLLGRLTYSTILAAVGALVLLPFMLTALVRFPAPKQAQGFPIAAAGRIVRDPMLLLMGIMLFVESGMEISVGGWTATFFKEELGLSEERALVLLSLYWLGMMLTRLVLGPVLRRASGVTVLFSCIGVGLVGALMTVNAHGTLGAGAGVFLIGCGLAQTFPVVLGFVGDRYAELSGTAFSVVIIMALVGGMLMPYGMGVLGAAYGLRGSFMLIPAALVLLATLLALLSHARIAVAREHAGRVE